MTNYLLFMFMTALSFSAQSQKALSAEEILKSAYASAAKDKMNVMVIFHASWCGWCRKMDTSLNDPSVKEYFDKNYVIEHLVIDESPDKKNLENPGAEDLNKKWGGGNQGLPYWVVLDKDGNVLADSQRAPGKNVGCPATKEEVDHSIKVLKKTSTITDEQVIAVEKRFRKNEL
jgi:thioredoxin-related protein